MKLSYQNLKKFGKKSELGDYSDLFSQNRLWRKTRSPQNVRLNCYGVDTNRNWGVAWSGQ